MLLLAGVTDRSTDGRVDYMELDRSAQCKITAFELPLERQDQQFS